MTALKNAFLIAVMAVMVIGGIGLAVGLASLLSSLTGISQWITVPMGLIVVWLVGRRMQPPKGTIGSEAETLLTGTNRQPRSNPPIAAGAAESNGSVDDRLRTARSILVAELSDGCRDRVVAGGLAAYPPSLSRQIAALSTDPALRRLTDSFERLLSDYAVLDSNARLQRATMAEKLISDALRVGPSHG